MIVDVGGFTTYGWEQVDTSFVPKFTGHAATLLLAALALAEATYGVLPL